MPQMAPLMWTPLMMSFSLLLVTMMIIMFFFAPIFNPISSETHKTNLISPSNKNWTW